jgi:hypothetical protein
MTAEPAGLATGVAVPLGTTFEPDILLVSAEVDGSRHCSMTERVELVVGELAADSAEELVLSAPFEIKLPIREIAP